MDNVYGDSTPSYRTVTKLVAEFKAPERGFEDASRSARPSTTFTDENIRTIERIVMYDRQISVRRVANELGIAKIRVHCIMSNYLSMNKVYTRWVPKLLTPLGKTVNGQYYASTIERLRCSILEKRRGKVSHGVLLLHDNAPVHKSNIVQAAISQAGFTELHQLIIIYFQI